jgi:ATP-binding cassette subfamily C (CFTR/MRP) protein 2
VAKLPFLLLFSFAFLFYYLGLSFFAGILVLVLGALVNTALAYFNGTVWKQLSKMKDARMNATTESLSNIKMLKLYAWNQNFQNRISEKRDMELS